MAYLRDTMIGILERMNSLKAGLDGFFVEDDD